MDIKHILLFPQNGPDIIHHGYKKKNSFHSILIAEEIFWFQWKQLFMCSNKSDLNKREKEQKSLREKPKKENTTI